ncbi:hypothetical protein BCVP_CDS0187 [Bacillus phage BC-VP]|nr:hypothetical protein BCVP_CDS0187 [Bacillus phage BC-VP]
MAVEYYLILGVDVGYEEPDEDMWEIYDSYKDTSKNIYYLLDEMRGEYHIVGKVLSYGDREDGIGHKTFDTDLHEYYFDVIQEIKAHIQEKFGVYDEPRLHVLAHYY